MIFAGQEKWAELLPVDRATNSLRGPQFVILDCEKYKYSCHLTSSEIESIQWN